MAEVILNGPAGRLEGRYVSGSSEKSATALFLHPSPSQGGTMNNKVIYSLFQTFAAKGFSCLRINFRGVGRSEGQEDKEEGYLKDATLALDWLQRHHPNSKNFWVIGFSFGAWIAMQLLMRRPEINYFIAAAPPTNQLDFSFLIPCPAPGLILQGDKDTMTSEKNVNEFAERLNAQKRTSIDYVVIPGANYSFSNHLCEISQEAENYIDRHLHC